VNVYDFVVWKSFPSSAKIDGGGWWRLDTFYVVPGTIEIEVTVKQKDVTEANSHIALLGWDEHGTYVGRLSVNPPLAAPGFPLGSFDWTVFSGVATIPENVSIARVDLAGGKGITWFDDLKIYQNGELIYEEYFSASPIHNIIPTAPRPEENSSTKNTFQLARFTILYLQHQDLKNMLHDS